MTRHPGTRGRLMTPPSLLDSLTILSSHGGYRLAGLVVLVALGTPCAAQSGVTPERALVHRTAGGVTFEVISKGLTRIAFQDRDLARGEWSVFNAESWFTRAGAGGPVKTGQLAGHAIEILSPTHARVRHRNSDIVCVFDYTFDGEDATIRARVENNHDTAEMAVTGFSGLAFTFGRRSR